MHLKRVGIALLAGALTLFLLVAIFGSSAPIAVLGDGRVNVQCTLRSPLGEMITGSSSGGMFGYGTNEMYSISYGGQEVTGIDFIVYWDIPGEYIDWDTLKVRGILYHVDEVNQKNDKLSEFTSSSRDSEAVLGSYAPTLFVNTQSLPVGSFNIPFKVVMTFDAEPENGGETMHSAAVGWLRVWLYNDGGKPVDGPTEGSSAAEIQGELGYDPDYTGGTGIYEDFQPPPNLDRASSVLRVSSGGSLIAFIIAIVVMYAVFKAVK